MSSSSHHVIRDFSRVGRPYWLPPGGWGNNLDDDRWVAIADLTTEYAASDLMMTLAEAHVPAYAALLSTPWRQGRTSRGARPVRIWVGAHAYGRAQNAIMAAMPGLLQRFGPDVLRG